MNQNKYRVGEIWHQSEEAELVKLINDGVFVSDIADRLGRNEGGVIARAEKLSKESSYLISDLNLARINREYCSNFGFSNTTTIEIITPSEEIPMNQKTWTMVSLLQEDIITIAVRFKSCSNNLYTYKTRDKSIDVDDYVIVDTSSGYQVVEVVEVHFEPQFDLDSGIRYKWIVGKIDTKEYEQLTENDQKAYDILVDAEKLVAKRKLVDLYKDSLGLERQDELQKLLTGKLDNID